MRLQDRIAQNEPAPLFHEQDEANTNKMIPHQARPMATALLVGLDQLLRAISPDCQTFRPNWTVAATREDPHDFQSRRADDASSIRLGVLTVRKGLRNNLIYRPQSTDALITAGQHALFWTDKIDTTAAKDRDIVLGGGMKPHFTIHGRRH